MRTKLSAERCLVSSIVIGERSKQDGWFGRSAVFVRVLEPGLRRGEMIIGG